MARWLDWLRNGHRLAGEASGLGDFDPYVVQLVRKKALLRARVEAPKLN